ncbi:MAG: AAA family ATPase [Acidimicrobiia bacterium]|nr:AAA family ATPase [Acidimicrobiia bacterium]
MTTEYDWDQLGILIVDDDDEFLDDAKRAFEGRVPTARTLADAQRAVESGDIGLVILGPSHAHEAGIKAAAMLLDLDSDLSLALVAGTVTAPLLKAALRGGLVDVIEAPLSTTKLAEILGDIGTRSERRPVAVSPVEPYAPNVPREGRIITVMSAKGGSGKTVMATNLAMLLAQNHDATRVVVVDADLQFGDVCLVLQLEPKLTVVNAAQEIHRLDEALLDSLLTKHPTGMSVLAAPLEPAFADEISTAAMVEILGKLRSMFDYVVVDTASLLDELLLSLLERADDVLFVVDMDLPSVKNAKLALETLRLLKFPSAKIQIVLNRSNAKARLDDKEIEKSLKMKISATVPSDGLVPASVNEGRPVVESAPKSKVAKGFESVYKMIVSETSESSRASKRRWL